MANTPKQFVRQAAPTSSATLYTVGSNKTAVITNISVTNTTGAAATVTILFDDVEYLSALTIGTHDTLVLDMKTVLSQTNTIKGFASVAGVNLHISGVEF